MVVAHVMESACVTETVAMVMMVQAMAAAQAKGMSDDELYTMLSYFDVKNFTDRIQCPVLMAIGLQDTVCPPHTNFAGYNQIKTEKSWICYPAAGHNVWQQEGWSVAREDFLKKYL